jgi:hypothetical protein
MENVFWKGYCNDERSTAINKIQTVVSAFGDIIDFKFFSDISITIVIEIKECKIDNLHSKLRDNIGIDNYKYLNSVSEKERTIYLNITFLKGTGNLQIETPSVPG